MARGRIRLEWDQTSLLWAQQANQNRDPKEHPQPFLPSDVHPLRTAADYTNDDAQKKTVDAIKRTCKVRRLKNVSLSNRSRESVS